MIRDAEIRCYVCPLYTTRSGVLVEERDRRTEPSGRIKIAAYRWHTGGFHACLSGCHPSLLPVVLG